MRDPQYVKTLRPVVRAALVAGWRWETKKGGHLMLRSPTGQRVPVPTRDTKVSDVFRKTMATAGVLP